MSEPAARDRSVIAAGGVVTPDTVLRPGWLEVAGERIAAVGAGAPPRPPDVDLPDALLAPGFVDMHVHGGGGRSYTEPDLAAAAQVAELHLRHGTTSTMASLVTADVDELASAVERLTQGVREGWLAGVHLEGPWLSRAHHGAHDPHWLRPPIPRDVDRLLSTGAVRMVTIAPELDGGIEAIRRIVAAGAVAAVGHTDASYEQTGDAIAAGARVGTHLYNAMRSPHHREPGPALALLESPEVVVELVADGNHLHPAALRHAARSVGPGRWALVTDAMAAAGGSDGTYQLGGLSVSVSDGRAVVAGSQQIAGSTLTMAAAVRYAVQQAGLELIEVLRAASTTPARVLGLQEVGELSPGRRADAVALAADLEAVGVLRAGRWVARAAARSEGT